MIAQRLLALASVLFGLGAISCDDDPTEPDANCDLRTLPLAVRADGPVVTDVTLEVQDGEGIIVLATATDPQGTEDLRDVQQSLGIFRSTACEGPLIVVRDDLAGSGVEESFGTAVDALAEASLFDQIASAQSWPVEVEFRDGQGNVTNGRVAARVVR